MQHASPEILAILTNREVIAVDEDQLGKQGTCLSKSADQEIWVKELSGGAKAIGLFNLSPNTARISITWSSLAFERAPRHVRDLWQHKNVNATDAVYSADIPSHGVVMLRVMN